MWCASGAVEGSAAAEVRGGRATQVPCGDPKPERSCEEMNKGSVPPKSVLCSKSNSLWELWQPFWSAWGHPHNGKVNTGCKN